MDVAALRQFYFRSKKTISIHSLWSCKKSEFVMADLIRHLENAELTGFWIPDLVRHMSRRNIA